MFNKKKLNKTKIMEVGGFPEITKGWGCEDMAFGFLCISNGMYIIPNKKIVRHIMHNPITGSIDENLKQLKNNLYRYKKWGNEIDKFPVIDFIKINKRIKNVKYIEKNKNKCDNKIIKRCKNEY